MGPLGKLMDQLLALSVALWHDLFRWGLFLVLVSEVR